MPCLEDHFLMLWKAVGGPPLEREYRFHAERRWRADFAHLQARVLIEVKGGIWVNRRHNRADYGKHLVLELVAEQFLGPPDQSGPGLAHLLNAPD